MKNTKKEFISKSELARRLGVSPSLVTNGIRKGRFQVVKKQVKGVKKEFVEFHECKRIYIATSNSAGSPPVKGTFADQVQKAKGNTKGLEDDVPKDPNNLFNLHDVKLILERAKAQKAVLDLEIAQGKHVEYEKVKKEFEGIASDLKKSVLAIPDRIGAIIAGETDEHECKQLLLRELKRSLAGIVKSQMLNVSIEND